MPAVFAENLQRPLPTGRAEHQDSNQADSISDSSAASPSLAPPFVSRQPHPLSWRAAAAADAEWMSGKSRSRLAPVSTEASSWMSDRSRLHRLTCGFQSIIPKSAASGSSEPVGGRHIDDSRGQCEYCHRRNEPQRLFGRFDSRQKHLAVQDCAVYRASVARSVRPGRSAATKYVAIRPQEAFPLGPARIGKTKLPCLSEIFYCTPR